MKAFKTNLLKIINRNFPNLEIQELAYPLSTLLSVEPRKVSVEYRHDHKSLKILWSDGKFKFSCTVKDKPVLGETSHFANVSVFNNGKRYYTIQVTDKESYDHKFFMLFVGYVFDRAGELLAETLRTGNGVSNEYVDNK